MWLSSICLLAVSVHVRALDFLVYLQPLMIFTHVRYILPELPPSHSLSDEDECHHLELRVKLSCCKAPARPSCLLISSGRGQGVRQGRVAAQRPHCTQGPARRLSCRPRCCVISAPSAAEGRCRSHTIVHSSSCEDPIHTRAHKQTQKLSCEQ